MLIFSGSAHPKLAQDLAHRVKRPLQQPYLKRFNDGELHCEISQSVRDQAVLIVQPTCPPVNEHLFELMLISEALRRAGASSITAVVPYLGYSRQDRLSQRRQEPLAARLMADCLAIAGIQSLVTLEVHSEQTLGFFKMPVMQIQVQDLIHTVYPTAQTDLVVVAPDLGGATRARACAQALTCDYALCDKRHNKPGQVLGEVRDKRCVIVDDILDSGQTVLKTAQTLKQAGARQVDFFGAHGLFSVQAPGLFDGSLLHRIYVSDSIPKPLTRIQSSRLQSYTIVDAIAHALNLPLLVV